MENTSPPAATLAAPPRANWLAWLHRVSALVALPFLLVSIAIAVGLTHVDSVFRLSEAIYDSKPIPEVRLDEAVRPGSWEQALAVVKKTGVKPYYIGERRGQIEVIALTGEPEHERTSRIQRVYLLDPATLRITRLEDESNSLFRQAHNVHGLRIPGIEWLSVALITTVALLVQLATGVVMAWRKRKVSRADATDTPLARWHARAGLTLAVLTLIIALTTLQMEYGFFESDKNASHPIPAVSVNGALRPGSLDQARAVAAQVMGATPLSAFALEGRPFSFSEAGDGIGGQSVWIDPRTMAVTRITDWRNDISKLNFIIHDGRWLGGMNAFNINDAAALGLLFLALSGVAMLWRKRKSQRA